jgi:hypothetical protein
MFSLGTYLTSSTFAMIANSSSRFFFRSLPSMTISETTPVTAGNGINWILKFHTLVPTFLVCDRCSLL